MSPSGHPQSLEASYAYPVGVRCPSSPDEGGSASPPAVRAEPIEFTSDGLPQHVVPRTEYEAPPLPGVEPGRSAHKRGWLPLDPRPYVRVQECVGVAQDLQADPISRLTRRKSGSKRRQVRSTASPRRSMSDRSIRRRHLGSSVSFSTLGVSTSRTEHPGRNCTSPMTANPASKRRITARFPALSTLPIRPLRQSSSVAGTYPAGAVRETLTFSSAAPASARPGRAPSVPTDLPAPRATRAGPGGSPAAGPSAVARTGPPYPPPVRA